MLRKIFYTVGGVVTTGALATTLAWGMPAPVHAAVAQQPVTTVAQQGPGQADQGQRADRLVVMGLIRATSEATGLTNKAVGEAVQGGQTLAQVAAANGSSGDAVVQAVVTKAKERLDRQVQAGRISQARADELLQRLTAKATTLVNDTTLGTKITARQEQAERRYTMPALMRAASEATGLPVGDIRGRLRDGESLRQIIESAGGNPQAVLDAATADFRAAAEAALDATR